MRRAIPLFVSIAALITGTLAIAGAPPAHADFQMFQSPSKGISCIYDDGADSDGKPFLSCEVRNYSGPLPARPKDCDLDWEARASLGATGKAVIGSCAGDTLANPDGPVLAYGSTFKRGAFTCTSTTAGMTCGNRSGNGFLASRRLIKRV